MSLEEEMKNEIRKLEKEIFLIDEELEKLHKKILQLMMIKKKKDHDLHILKSDLFGENDKEYQTTLARMLAKEGVKTL